VWDAAHTLNVTIDSFPDTLSFLHRFAVELSARNHSRLYVQERVAYGFQALAHHRSPFSQYVCVAYDSE
jgi:dTDP-4-dehydrorhamnose 3,5-epimerase-like enzyme